jgi:hypothetical protein
MAFGYQYYGSQETTSYQPQQQRQGINVDYHYNHTEKQQSSLVVHDLDSKDNLTDGVRSHIDQFYEI